MRLASDLLDKKPQNPTEFACHWIDDMEDKFQDNTCLWTLPTLDLDPSILLLTLTAWRDRVRAFEIGTECQMWRRRFAALEQALGQTQVGRDIIAAIQSLDEIALRSLCTPDKFNMSDHKAASVEVNDEGETINAPEVDVESLKSMNALLGALNARQITSASAAFSYFEPVGGLQTDDSYIEKKCLINRIEDLDVLERRHAVQLAHVLDRSDCGSITYRDFRSVVIASLASSSDLHPPLTDKELQTILLRLRRRFDTLGHAPTDIFKNSSIPVEKLLDGATFIEALTSLRLGLSRKEAAQLFNALAEGSSTQQSNSRTTDVGGENEAEHRRGVAIETLTALLEQQSPSKQNELIEHARSVFERLGRSSVRFGTFASLVAEANPCMSQADVHLLWCVFDKDDATNDAAVNIQQLMHWMLPSEQTTKEQESS